MQIEIKVKREVKVEQIEEAAEVNHRIRENIQVIEEIIQMILRLWIIWFCTKELLCEKQKIMIPFSA